MGFKYLLYEKKEGILRLTLNRKEALNALSREMLRELDEFLTSLNGDKDTRVLVVSGAGEKAFAAGADIREMKDFTPEEAWEFSRMGHRIFAKLEKLKIPTIACIRGYALGGGLELALSCDLRIAGTSARLGQPETGLGIIPGFGGTQRLSRLIGPAQATWLIFTGKIIGAEEAFQLGLVNLVVDDERLEDAVEETAKTISTKSPVALARAKRAISVSVNTSLEEGLKLESDLFSSCFETDDPQEGMTSFLAKRKPKFSSL